MGKNASGQTHYLSLSGFEIYGTVTSVCEDIVTSAKVQNNIFLFSNPSNIYPSYYQSNNISLLPSIYQSIHRSINLIYL